MGGRRPAPSRIINTPEGPRERSRMAGESMRRASFSPTKRSPMFTMARKDKMQDKDMEARRIEKMQRREERRQTFGDSFREQRREERMSRRGMDEESLEKRQILRKIRTRADKPEE